MKPRRTEKQKEIMGLILRAAGNGTFLTTTEIHEQVSYEASYGAIRVSIRFLVGQGMLERRSAGQFTHLVPTLKGYDWFRPAAS
jgi:hypothetical protein